MICALWLVLLVLAWSFGMLVMLVSVLDALLLVSSFELVLLRLLLGLCQATKTTAPNAYKHNVHE